MTNTGSAANTHIKANSKGFTLLEVLVAITIFALIGVVLMEVTASTTNNTLRVRSDTYATWIAENKLAELRLEEGLPAPREYKEDIEFGVDEWQLVTKVIGTENPDIHRVEVTVSLETDDEPRQIRTVTGFIGRY